MTKKIKILIVVLCVVIVGLGGSLVYAYRGSIISFKDKIANKGVTDNQANSNLASVVTNVNSNVANSNTATTTANVMTPLVDSGITWMSPQKVDDLKLIKTGTDAGVTGADYYKIATISTGGAVYLADVSYEGPAMSKTFVRFLSGSDNKFYYLKKYSEDFGGANFLTDGVLVDDSTTYSQISSPEVVQTDVGPALSKSGGNYLFKDLDPVPTKIAQSIYGDIYSSAKNADSQAIAMRSIYLKHADGTVTAYAEKIPFMTNGIPDITLASGVKNTAKYIPNTIFACGSVSDTTVVTAAFNPSSYTVFGQTGDKDNLYTSNDVNNDVVKGLYDNYKTGRTADVKSIADFAKATPYFFWKDLFGNYIVFVSEDYTSQAECGKPVIYLYPTKPTNVRVKVDAVITKSEPDYADGWNVLANPDGKLSINNTVFPYLYWEGTGKEYPTINSGFVVKQSELKSTLEKQLQSLGLNSKEEADFLQFWLPKMPATPYIRLSWLGTSDMNKLAPLKIVPQPDTLIRVFLDFQGLTKPISIPSQKLSSVPRSGFTVVEWGGLLIK